MKGAIASVELFVFESGQRTIQTPRRLTLTIGAPVRERDGDPGSEWSSRVALADLHRPEIIRAQDSVSALAEAFVHVRSWLDALDAQGFFVARDRTGETPFELNGESNDGAA